MIALIILGGITIITRIFQYFKFFKLVSKIYYIYDRNYLNEHGDENHQLISDYMDKDHTTKSEWSAYKWLFLKGPSPYSILFSLKPLTIEGQYGSDAVNTLTTYYVFEDYELEK